MDTFLTLMTPAQMGLALSIAVLAGLVKGVVGFAMPMVLISGLSTFLAPELALAGLIVPTLVTNAIQALRQGIPAAWQAIRRFRVFLVVGGVVLIASAQLVRILPMPVLLTIIGLPVVGFVLIQLLGVRVSLTRQTPGIEASVGAFAGFIGGLSGIWGPPTVLYLTALGTEKHEQMRAQGVIYGLGAVALLGAHIGSGVLRPGTWELSIALVPPAVLGLWIGGRVLDRIDQAMFRRVTLLVLLVVGLNLVRRAIMSY